MAYTEKSEWDVTVLPPWEQISVREAKLVLKDNVELTRHYKRYMFAPGDDVSGVDAKVKTIADAVWTDDVKKKWSDYFTAVEAKRATGNED